MGKSIIIAIIFGFISTMAIAGEGGMADRINETRSYPNKVVVNEISKSDASVNSVDTSWIHRISAALWA